MENTRLVLATILIALRRWVYGGTPGFSGTIVGNYFYGYQHDRFVTGQDAIAALARRGGAHGLSESDSVRAVSDRQLVRTVYSHGSAYTATWLLDGRAVARYEHRHADGGRPETWYYDVAGIEATKEEWDSFEAAAAAMVPQPFDADAAVAALVERAQCEADLASAFEAEAGAQIGFGQICGSSYFGSGGGYGSVRCYDLDAMRQGRYIKVDVELQTLDKDNGFVRGPIAATTPVGRVVVVASGGDCIGEGRYHRSVFVPAW